MMLSDRGSAGCSDASSTIDVNNILLSFCDVMMIELLPHVRCYMVVMGTCEAKKADPAACF